MGPGPTTAHEPKYKTTLIIYCLCLLFPHNHTTDHHHARREQVDNDPSDPTRC
ncbi:hypothetical protein BGW80DRAFT_1408872 [Lactifluus volemus]|nr:hypothetical protein BGW80DRAFT_1408872 [Lactifluus volemus]